MGRSSTPFWRVPDTTPKGDIFIWKIPPSAPEKLHRCLFSLFPWAGTQKTFKVRVSYEAPLLVETTRTTGKPYRFLRGHSFGVEVDKCPTLALIQQSDFIMNQAVSLCPFGALGPSEMSFPAEAAWPACHFFSFLGLSCPCHHWLPAALGRGCGMVGEVSLIAPPKVPVLSYATSPPACCLLWAAQPGLCLLTGAILFSLDSLVSWGGVP